jgi:hypothetical protein
LAANYKGHPWGNIWEAHIERIGCFPFMSVLGRLYEVVDWLALEMKQADLTGEP